MRRRSFCCKPCGLEDPSSSELDQMSIGSGSSRRVDVRSIVRFPPLQPFPPSWAPGQSGTSGSDPFRTFEKGLQSTNAGRRTSPPTLIFAWQRGKAGPGGRSRS